MKILHVLALAFAAGAGLAQAPARANDAALLADVFAQKAEPDERRAIAALVSPGQLFPVEGILIQSRGNPGAAASYRPLAAYDKPAGAAIGEVRMANAGCLRDFNADGCDAGYAWYLQTRAERRFRLAAGEYSYGTDALLSYRPSVRKGGALWSEIAYAEGSFWIATDAAERIAYEDLVHVADKFDRWCTAPGRCRPVSRAMAGQLARVRDGDVKLLSCYREAYEVAGWVAFRGRRYYRVALAKVEPGQAPARLPKSGYIPVRNRDGSHTGTFYSRGC
ncbi:hypothetical protein [Janthinobacterium sp.]|uniref:hypothetical protein n=1 Tax=Janthinobacterium sp. TaxID=1871054 RepID=UPI00293D80F6|nr:hypothetical protein [Janthinobacterium sp.]